MHCIDASTYHRQRPFQADARFLSVPSRIAMSPTPMLAIDRD